MALGFTTQVGCGSNQEATEITATESEVEAYERMMAEEEGNRESESE